MGAAAVADGSVSWHRVVPDSDVAAYRAAGYGLRGGLGPHLALLVVDMTYAFTGLRPEAGSAGGAEDGEDATARAWAAVDATVPLLAAFRSAGRPVFYTEDVSMLLPPERNVWARKQRSPVRRGPEDARVVRELAPEPADEVVTKDRPSAFFETELAGRLRERGVQDLLVVGGTTSGCVRASVVDAFSHGFAVGVVAECVFDRSRVSHAVNLFDLDQKYADVLTRDEALRVVRESGTSPRPTGGRSVFQ
jgi:nicotinamidase-related amidase